MFSFQTWSIDIISLKAYLFLYQKYLAHLNILAFVSMDWGKPQRNFSQDCHCPDWGLNRAHLSQFVQSDYSIQTHLSHSHITYT
jgi:hypothetical protein